jgi:hypothetical protein
MNYQVFVCDRCKSETKNGSRTSHVSLTVELAVDRCKVSSWDLCSECTSMLTRFMENEQAHAQQGG